VGTADTAIPAYLYMIGLNSKLAGNLKKSEKKTRKKKEKKLLEKYQKKLKKLQKTLKEPVGFAKET
jgi:hypothetical protein